MKIYNSVEEIPNEINISSLICGDCLSAMDKIPSKSVDLIVCDLPYGTTKNRWDIVIPFDQLWKHYERIIKPSGNILLFGVGIFAYELALSNKKLYRYDLIWKKSKCGSPLTAKYMPMKKHEMILVFGKSASYYKPQLTEGTPYKRKYTPNKTNNMEYGIKGVETDNKGTRHPTTILDFPQKWRRQDQLHPTQKPLELIEWLIESYSKEGDLILDNTMGSGTTILGAKNKNRRYIGIENDKQIFDVALKRIFN